MKSDGHNTKPNSALTGRVYPLIAAIVAVLVGIDQLTKQLAVIHLKDQAPRILIRGVLALEYLENRGAAWGMLQNRQWVFWIITIAFLIALVVLFIRVPKERIYLPLILAGAVLAAGAIGNFIDRIRLRYVVDFISFFIIRFPIFNVADIYVTLSVIALLILVLFRYKEHELSFLRGGRGAEDADD